ncbi:MAG: acetylornithine transaminase [Deltaproteobacteria bacterium]|nr:acetylornithine transaminase [Deltaproteobacteria bacterium]
MGNREIIDQGDRYLLPTYARYPLALVRGQGMRVWDADGRQYLDFLAGIAVCNLGHCHPRVVEAIRDQAGRLLHVSNLYYIEPQGELAQLLVEHTFANKVFFCNSGAEANEGAIKLARKFQKDRGEPRRVEILSAAQSFHGRTLATLTATGQDKVKVGFDPLPAGFRHVAYDDLGALEAAVGPETAAILLEPIQGEGGVRVPSPGYLRAVRELCDARGALLVFDEVQVGMGRTGTFLACEHEGVAPDLCTLAKGLGGGVPIGALLTTEVAGRSFGPGSHGSTFGGNPLATAAALATVRTIVGEGTLEHCRAMGAYFADALRSLAASCPSVTGVRGRGLLLGVELRTGVLARDVVQGLMARGFLAGTAGDQVLRFAPPLIVEKEEIGALLVALDDVLQGL